MAQTAAQRKAAQRRVAKQLREGTSPLGGEFRRHVEQELQRRQIGPDIIEPIDPALLWARQEYAEDEDIPLTYVPTNTTWPENGWDHRRTTEAGYNRATETLAVKFYTNGAVYHYYDVKPQTAIAFRRTESPGKFINRVLNAHDYERID